VIRKPLRERGVGGLGIYFVRSFMDEVAHDRAGERNRLVLRKRLKTCMRESQDGPP
jgi:anti-sigma regulatory factor (Ser/Thr protein kinase)